MIEQQNIPVKNIGGIFAYSRPHSNLDSYYGPYTTKEEANAKTEGYRDIGLTVGIKEFTKDDNGLYIKIDYEDEFLEKTYPIYVEDESANNQQRYSFIGIEEYYYKRTIDTLEKKGESSLILQLISPSRIRTSENVPIKIQILGGITPNSILVYEVKNDQEFSTSYSYPGIIPLNGEISLDLNMSGSPRTIIYRIKVTDKNNQYAKTIDDKNYVEVIVDFKEIELYNLNLNNINGLIVKNANNLQGKTFTFSVGYVESITNYNVNLYIGETKINEAIENLGNDSYRATIPNHLSEFGGLDITIKTSYTRTIDELEDEGSNDTFIVTIMAKNIFSNIQSEIIGDIFYIGNKVECKIYFEAESQETYSIISDVSSDFLYEGRIMSYTWNTIYINPVNITNTPEFTFKLGGIKDVTVTSTGKISNFTKLVFADSNRIPDDPRTEEFKENHESLYDSFILDINGFINWTQDSRNIFEIGNITITKDLISFGSIKYPTPLQRDIHLGFEFQVSAENTIYNALYIDGVLCKNVKLESSNIGGVKLNNLKYNTYSDSFIIKNINIYVKLNGYLNPFTSINFANSTKYIPIIQNNYEYYTLSLDNPEELPVLKLTALSLTDSLYNIRNNVLTKNGKKLDKAIIPSKFGSLQDGQDKYNLNINVDNINDENYPFNILLKQRTDLKKELQKSRGVLCSYEYGSYSGYVEVHTLGTSTLDYRLPNFKFTFLNNDMTNAKVNFVTGYTESVLTAKTDYMDSSHLNNTPTATYYNKIIHSGFFERTGNDKRSPSAKQNGLDAITGIPIIMSIKDVGETNFVNYGSFMLNVDKTGDALKFKVENEIDECISFEGTSNDLNSGLSSRFLILSDLNYYPNIITNFDNVHSNLGNLNNELYYYSTSTIDNDGVEHYYIDVLTKGSSVAKLMPEETSLSPSYICRNSVLLVLFYLAEGLEYRYPDGDIISVTLKDLAKKNKDKLEIMPLSHFVRLFKMFYWTANSGSLSQSDYKEQFVKYYNYDYCALYFIFLMIFAQTDNLGKNCMFDLWFNPDDLNNENRDCLWYPRPYDLDSLAGLDNNGNDGIAPFIEISPRFSLDYREKNIGESDSDYNNFLEQHYLKANSTLKYPESITNDLQGIAKRYSFSSSNSNLWFNFYKNFKNEIRETYGNLRNYKINESLVYDSEGTFTLLSSDIILKFYKEFVLDLFGYSLYNLDFLLKYLGDSSRQFFGLGNRWNKFSDWIKKRIQFCDIYFYYKKFDVELSVFSKELLLNSPLYVITRYGLGNANETIYFFDGVNKINVLISGEQISGEETATSGLKYFFWINPEAILEGNIYANLLSSDPKMPLDSIVNLNIGGNTLSNVVNIDNANYLLTMRINQLEIAYNNNLPSNIKTIIIENSSQFPDISNLEYLESITIDNCISKSGSLNLLGLGKNNPINLTIRNSELNLNLTNVKINNFVSENNIINDITINECIIPVLELLNQTIGNIGFSGSVSEIDIIDFRGSTFTVNSLDLSIVALNVKHLLLNDVKGLITITTSNKFENLKFIGLMNSSLENLVYDKEGEDKNIDHFDGKLLPDILPKSLYCKNYNEGLTNSKNSYTVDIIYSLANNDYYSGGSIATRSFNLEQTNITKVINLLIRDSNVVDNNPNCTGVTKLFTNCKKLVSIKNSNINCSGEKMFKNCSLLNNIDNTTISIDTNASYMFATCNSLSYNYIDFILQNNPNIENFNSFLLNTAFSENTTIDLSNYANATNMTKTFDFYSHSEAGFLHSYGNGITITFDGTIPSNVTTIERAFEFYTGGIGNYNFALFTDWDNLVKNCTSLTNMKNAFYYCKPSASGFYEIDSDWLPSSSQDLDIEGLFAYSNVKLKDKIENDQNKPFEFKSNIVSCHATFYSCITSSGYTYDVSNIFKNCTKLEDIMLCFYNNQWATVSNDGLVLNNSDYYVKILGTFATSNVNNYPVVNGKISGKYTCSTDASHTFHHPLSSPIPNEDGKLGTFESRKVDLPINSTLIYNSPELYNMFRGAVVNNANNNSTILIQLLSENINRMFYNTNMNGAVLNVTLINGIVHANYAFGLLSKSYRNYYKFPTTNGYINPPKIPESLVNAQGIFYRQKINKIDIDYFKKDGEFLDRLKNVAYMFYGTDITELPINASYGLIPNTVTNVNYMFYNCALLKGGIPKNLFNTNTNLTSLVGVFGETGILFNKNSEYPDTMTPFSVKEQTPNVTDVTSLFYYNCVLGMSQPLNIKYDSFENCTTLNNLFAFSLETVNFINGINSTNEIKINSPINMLRTFVGTSKHIIINITNVDKLKDISGISQCISTDENITVSDYNNSITKSIYDLLSSLLSLVYSNYTNLMQNVTLDNCLGRWEKNTTQLENLGIPSDSSYEIAQYWYTPAPSGTISTGRGYVTN